MDSLGYIRGIESVVGRMGGSVIATIPMQLIDNPLNPTFCFVVTPPYAGGFPRSEGDEWTDIFSVPGTNYPLVRMDNFYASKAPDCAFRS